MSPRSTADSDRPLVLPYASGGCPARTGLNRSPAAGSVSSLPAAENRYDVITEIAVPAADVVAVHVRSNDPEPRSQTLLLDAATGEPLGGFSASHRVIGGAGGVAVLYREALHPEVSVVRVRD